MDYMNSPRPIVVGIDGSQSSQHAVRWAAAEAARKHAPLTILHVCWPIEVEVPTVVPLPRSYDNAVMTQGRAWLDEAVAAAGDVAPNITPHTELVRDRVTETLVARSALAQLVVLGSRGLGGFTGMLVGSTAVALTAHGHCPVAVVRSAAPDLMPPATGPVVVGVDGPSSDVAIEFAFDSASRLGVPLVAVHTWTEGTLAVGWDAIPYVVDWDAVQEMHEKELAARMAHWHEKYPDVELHNTVLRDRPNHGLVEQSKQAQLVVVGSRGRGGFTGLLLGSTSHALLYHAACPVVVTRPAE